MKIKLFSFSSLIAFVILGFISCVKSDSPNLPITPNEDFILIELKYENFAWGHSLWSKYITIEGQELLFDQNDPFNTDRYWNEPDEENYISFEALEENFNRADSVIQQFSAQEMEQLKALINTYDASDLEDPIGTCNDFGELILRTYKWNQEKEKFKAITIKQCGDISAVNNALSAIPIVNWVQENNVHTDWFCCN